MYECGKLKKVIGNKILFQVSLEQCELNSYGFTKYFRKLYKKKRSREIETMNYF